MNRGLFPEKHTHEAHKPQAQNGEEQMEDKCQVAVRGRRKGHHMYHADNISKGIAQTARQCPSPPTTVRLLREIEDASISIP